MVIVRYSKDKDMDKVKYICSSKKQNRKYIKSKVNLRELYKTRKHIEDI